MSSQIHFFYIFVTPQLPEFFFLWTFYQCLYSLGPLRKILNTVPSAFSTIRALRNDQIKEKSRRGKDREKLRLLCPFLKFSFPLKKFVLLQFSRIVSRKTVGLPSSTKQGISNDWSFAAFATAEKQRLQVWQQFFLFVHPFPGFG